MDGCPPRHFLLPTNRILYHRFMLQHLRIDVIFLSLGRHDKQVVIAFIIFSLHERRSTPRTGSS